MAGNFSDDELLGYLDEALAVERMTAIETALRGSASLRQRLAGLSAVRDAASPLVGDVWRRGRLSCPTRQQLGSYLLGALAADWTEYIAFHIETVGCRYCAANLEDLRAATQTSAHADAKRRRQKFFQSSAGYVPRQEL